MTESEVNTDWSEIRERANGKNASEYQLISLCNSNLLSLWCFPNPYYIDKTKKELCDELVVFKDHIFIFSDKFCKISSEQQISIAWNRWFKRAIQESARQIIGAEKQIREQPSNIYVDAMCTRKFPFKINLTESTKIHRIIVAKGTMNPDAEYSGLSIDTRITGKEHLVLLDNNNLPIGSAKPFFVGYPLDRHTIFHIFDEFTLSVILEELDSLDDFANYLTEKEEVLESGNDLMANGEEDILAHYLSTVENERHVILTEAEKRGKQVYHFLPTWESYVGSEGYATKKECDQKSYFWDAFIERTLSHLMKGTAQTSTVKNYDELNMLFTPFAEMSRIERRMAAELTFSAYDEAQVLNSSSVIESFTRTVCLSGSLKKYCIIIFVSWPQGCPEEKYREMRQYILDLAMREFKAVREPDATQIIGIAFCSDRSKDVSEDMRMIDLRHWTDEDTKQTIELLRLCGREVLSRSGKAVSGKEYESEIYYSDTPFPWVK